MVDVEYSSKFLRLLKKLPVAVQNLAQEKEEIFKRNHFDNRLGTHKLHGKDRKHWAYWITRKIRIKFLFLPNGNVLYLEIGLHDEIY